MMELAMQDLWFILATVAAAVFLKITLELLLKSMKEILPDKPCLENLSAKARAEVMKVHLTGAGICSRCRWSSGCYECEGAHALRYWLKQEGFDKELVLKLDAEAELKKLDADDVD